MWDMKGQCSCTSQPSHTAHPFLKALTTPCFALKMKGIASVALERLWKTYKLVRRQAVSQRARTSEAGGWTMQQCNRDPASQGRAWHRAGSSTATPRPKSRGISLQETTISQNPHSQRAIMQRHLTLQTASKKSPLLGGAHPHLLSRHPTPSTASVSVQKPEPSPGDAGRGFSMLYE